MTGVEAPAAVVFDLDDTLTDYRALEAEVWRDVARDLAARIPGADLDGVRVRYLANLEPFYERVLHGEQDMATFQRARLVDALAPWGEPDDACLQAYLATKQRLLDEVRPAAGAAEALAAVRRAGLRVGVLTNGPTDVQRDKLERIGLAGAVDVFCASEALGPPKPHAEAFLATAAALGVPAGRVAMVGDSLRNDIRGALEAGFAAAVLVTHGDPAPADVLAVRRVADAPAALGLGGVRSRG